jgi:hypothetical protein
LLKIKTRIWVSSKTRANRAVYIKERDRNTNVNCSGKFLEKKLKEKIQKKAEDEERYADYEEEWRKASDQRSRSSSVEWKQLNDLLAQIRAEILGISALKKGRAAVGKTVVCFSLLQ